MTAEYAKASVSHVDALEQRIEDVEQEFRNLASVIKRTYRQVEDNARKLDRLLALIEGIDES